MSQSTQQRFLKTLNRELDRRDRLTRLDSALLFLASATGLLFGFFQIFLGGYYASVFTFSALLVGWFAPFYVGYFTGAFRHDNMVDRIRGWIYLIIGLGFYSVFILRRTMPYEIAWWSIWIVYVVIAILVPFWLMRICEWKPQSAERTVLGLTAMAAVSLALGLFELSSGVSALLFGPSDFNPLYFETPMFLSAALLLPVWMTAELAVCLEAHTSYKVQVRRERILIVKLALAIVLLVPGLAWVLLNPLVTSAPLILPRPVFLEYLSFYFAGRGFLGIGAAVAFSTVHDVP